VVARAFGYQSRNYLSQQFVNRDVPSLSSTVVVGMSAAVAAAAVSASAGHGR
jgi:hypothetical protein